MSGFFNVVIIFKQQKTTVDFYQPSFFCEVYFISSSAIASGAF